MKFSEQSLSLAFDQMVVSAVPFTPALPDSPCRPKVGCKLEGWFQSKLKNFTFCLICCGLPHQQYQPTAPPLVPIWGFWSPRRRRRRVKLGLCASLLALSSMNLLVSVKLSNIRFLGPQLAPISTAKGPHFTKIWVPIWPLFEGKKLGLHSMWEQCQPNPTLVSENIHFWCKINSQSILRCG